MMDLLPTFAGLAGAAVSQDRIIDGKDIWPLWSEQARLDLGDLDHPGAG